jgi:molecular chaperone DnaJ
MRGDDLYYTLPTPFYDVINGNDYELNINHTINCTTCGGKGGEKGTCSACGGKGKRTQGRGGMYINTTCPTCGGTGQVTVKQCAKCHGKGHINVKERIKVKIPKGVDKNSKIRIQGKGNAGMNGGPQGDLYIITNVAEHTVFRREGDNLYVDVDIDMFEAALGHKIEVPTPYGNVSLNIPAGTQPGQKFRLKGKGVPKLKGGGHGDLYLVMKVNIPAVAVNDDRESLKHMMTKYASNAREELLKKGKI